MKITHVNFFFPTKRPSFIWTFIRHHEMVVFLIRMVLYMNLISTSLVLLSCSIVILDTAFFNSFCVDVDTVLAGTYFTFEGYFCTAKAFICRFTHWSCTNHDVYPPLPTSVSCNRTLSIILTIKDKKPKTKDQRSGLLCSP